jgi:hypothetical protein
MAVNMCYITVLHLACMSSVFMSWLLRNAVSFESKIVHLRVRSKITVSPTSFLYSIRILEHNGGLLFKKRLKLYYYYYYYYYY